MFPASDAPVAEVIARYGLVPLPDEGGFWAPVERTQCGNGIWFLMTPDADGFSALHRLSVAESWTFLAGAPARVLILGEECREKRLDADAGGVLMPPGVWQGGSTTGAWTLVACWCTPAFTDDCFEMGERAALTASFPDWADRIRELTR